jgi:RHS repeat-associated protein
VTFDLTDLHGDVVATAESSPTATKLKATYRFDEFGEPESGNAGRFGWLGGKARRTELPSGVVQMGARSYVPALGRFLTPDPVPGGSANPYDYAGQDPVNMFDLNGECVYGKKHPHCIATQSPKQLRQATRKANKARAIMIHFSTQAAAQRFVRQVTSVPSFAAGLASKAGEWKAREIQEVQAKAAKAVEVARVFGPPPAPGTHGEPSACTSLGAAFGLAGFGLALAPETGGASVVIGFLGAVTGVGSAAGC